MDKEYSLDDFDYSFPEDAIAQFPAEKREESRIYIPDGKVLPFKSIVDMFSENDLLVLNSSRVFKARIKATLQRKCRELELLFIRKESSGNWEAMVRGSKHLKKGDLLILPENIEAIVVEKKQYNCILKITAKNNFYSYLDKHGEVPLPPYIKRDNNNSSKEDASRYQTIYADKWGSAAAPTAGLHFTEQILKSLSLKGVEILTVTLHVGPGTFLPVRTENIYQHQMHSEHIELSESVASRLNAAKIKGKRITAVGTTTLRVLESCYKKENASFSPYYGETDIFICPPRKVASIDRLITNFHQPKSTLFMLVAAFSGLDEIKKIYDDAISSGLRLFSYGDAVFLHNINKGVC